VLRTVLWVFLLILRTILICNVYWKQNWFQLGIVNQICPEQFTALCHGQDTDSHNSHTKHTKLNWQHMNCFRSSTRVQSVNQALFKAGMFFRKNNGAFGRFQCHTNSYEKCTPWLFMESVSSACTISNWTLADNENRTMVLSWSNNHEHAIICTIKLSKICWNNNVERAIRYQNPNNRC